MDQYRIKEKFGLFNKYKIKNHYLTQFKYQRSAAKIVRSWHKEIKFKPKIILDVGANIGLYTLALNSFYPEATIYAFEPVEINFNLLKEHVQENDLKEKIKCYQNAVWSASGFVLGLSIPDYRPDKENTGLYSVYQKGKTEFRATTLSLDDHCTREKIVPDLVKIDVEGSEIEVVRGMRKIIRRIRFIVIEKHLAPEMPDYELVEKYLKKSKFELVASHKNEIWKNQSL